MFTLDVSEVLQWLGCRRQWWLNSGNTYALEIGDTSKALRQGTIFHEALAMLYKGGTDLEPYLRYIKENKLEPIDWMLQEYVEGPLILDLSIFEILDVEWKFAYPMRQLFGHLAPEGIFRGAIDVVVRHKRTGEIWGIEHKTATHPRVNAEVMQHDLQCLTYVAALQLRYNGEVSGIMVSEFLKNTKMDFLQHQRILVQPTAAELGIYRNEMIDYINQIHADIIKKNREDPNPNQGVNQNQNVKPNASIPGGRSKDFLTCNWCKFKKLCNDILLDDIISEEVWGTWSPLIRQRDKHHLDMPQEV